MRLIDADRMEESRISTCRETPDGNRGGRWKGRAGGRESGTTGILVKRQGTGGERHAETCYHDKHR